MVVVVVVGMTSFRCAVDFGDVARDDLAGALALAAVEPR